MSPEGHQHGGRLRVGHALITWFLIRFTCCLGNRNSDSRYEMFLGKRSREDSGCGFALDFFFFCYAIR